MKVMLMQEPVEEKYGEQRLRKGKCLQVIKVMIMKMWDKGSSQKLESAPQDVLYAVLSLIQKTKPPYKDNHLLFDMAGKFVHKVDKQ